MVIFGHCDRRKRSIRSTLRDPPPVCKQSRNTLYAIHIHDFSAIEHTTRLGHAVMTDTFHLSRAIFPKLIGEDISHTALWQPGSDVRPLPNAAKCPIS